MQKTKSKENIDEVNQIKVDYKLNTFTNGFHNKIYSFHNNKEQNKVQFKKKFPSVKGEKLNKQDLNRFNSKPGYITDLWNKIISKNLKTLDESSQNKSIEILFKSNKKIYYKNKINKMMIKKKSNNLNVNDNTYKNSLNNPLCNSFNNLEIGNNANNDFMKDNKDKREEINNLENATYNDFYKFNNEIKNGILFPKLIKINKKYKKLYEEAINENNELKKENEQLKNKIKEKNDEIDIMKEEDELNKESIKTNENRLNELYEYFMQKINIYEQKIFNYKELLFKKDQEIQRMLKEIQKMETSKKSISIELNEKKNKIFKKEIAIKEYNNKTTKFEDNIIKNINVTDLKNNDNTNNNISHLKSFNINNAEIFDINNNSYKENNYNKCYEMNKLTN
jgi:hypothetical protein